MINTIGQFAPAHGATVTVEPFAGDSGLYMTPTFGAAVSYKARIVYRQRWVRRSDGTEVLSIGEVWLRSNDDVDHRSRLTLPDGRTPPILRVDRPHGPDGTPHHTKVFFG